MARPDVRHALAINADMFDDMERLVRPTERGTVRLIKTMQTVCERHGWPCVLKEVSVHGSMTESSVHITTESGMEYVMKISRSNANKLMDKHEIARGRDAE